MKIVLVYNYLPTQLGGVETVMDALAVEFARAGHDVVAIGADVPERTVRPTPTEYRLAGVPVANLLESRLGVPYPLPHPRLASLLRREIATADIIFGHGFLCAPTLAAFALAREHLRAAPVCILMEHVGFISYPSRALSFVERSAIQTLGRATAGLSDGVVVCSTRVQAELRALAPGRTVEWIASGVDPRRYPPASPDERQRLRASLGWDGRPRVLFVGRVTAPKKGLGVLLETAARGQGAFDVVLAGPGELPGAAPPHVQVLGTLPPARVAELYRAADAFLLPSYGEGFPVTVLEAMASACPVLLGDDPLYAPYVEGAAEGLQLVPRDAGEIVTRLSDLLRSRERLERARADALRHVQGRFTWARAAEQHLAFARRMQGAKRAS